jgi:hypothetical protein
MRIIAILFFSLIMGGCATAQRPHAVGSDPTPGAEFTLSYKIGRWDSNGIFHGTDYNDKQYPSKVACEKAYEETIQQVRDGAADKGGTVEVQDRHVASFRSLYKCYEITLDTNHEISPRPVQALPAPTRQYRAPVTQEPPLERYSQPIEQNYLPQEARISPQAGPLRPYYMAEYISLPGRRPYWVTFASVYESPAQCWKAVRLMLGDERLKIEAEFTRTSRDYNASVNFQYRMEQFRDRTRRISCVQEGRF